MKYYSAIKKNEILPVATAWMEEEVIMLSEIGHRERQIPYDFTYIWNLKNKINKQNRNRLKNREQADGCQRGMGFRGRVKKVKGLRSTDW